MDQIKIGSFISVCRKSQGWTQSQLAERLGITDKAVSKWETGKSMPDLSLFMPLCALLRVTLNEVLAGEPISEANLKEKSNEVLMEVISSWLGQDKWQVTESSDEDNKVLVLQEVQKVYKTETSSTLAVNRVSFQISKGSFVGIMGASGSGKTTLLHLIATIDKPTGGTIELNGQMIGNMSEKDLAKFRREHLGFVFQEYNLLDTLTIYENIALALTIKETPKKNVKHIISELAEKLEISSILHKFPYEVSGGQRQHCACARAIAVNPSLILADEPTGALDSYSAKQLLNMMVMLRKEYEVTILMVTHDALSASYCDRILFMKDGEIKDILDRNHETKQIFFTSILETMALILVILAGYINSFMLKQRGKEFANYLLLGIEKSKLSWMLLVEFLVIGLVCFVIGSLLGLGMYTVFHSTMSYFGGNLLKDTKMQLSFFIQSLGETFLYFCFVEFMTAFRIKRSFDKLQIMELMFEKKRSQKLGGRPMVWLWGDLFGISLLSLTGLLFGIVFLSDDIANFIISIIAIPLLVAIVFFYKWLFQFLVLKRRKQSESLFWHNRLYMIAQMTSMIKTNAIMNSVFCICLIFSVMSFVVGMFMLRPEITIFNVETQLWMGFLQITLCIIFIVIYFSILSLQQMMEFGREAKNIQLLYYIGRTKTQTNVLVVGQIMIKLSLPSVMCIIPLFIAVPLVNYKLNLELTIAMRHIVVKSVTWFLVCYLTLFVCYFLVVSVTSKKYVEKAINTDFL